MVLEQFLKQTHIYTYILNHGSLWFVNHDFSFKHYCIPGIAFINNITVILERVVIRYTVYMIDVVAECYLAYEIYFTIYDSVPFVLMWQDKSQLGNFDTVSNKKKTVKNWIIQFVTALVPHICRYPLFFPQAVFHYYAHVKFD